MGEQKVSFHQGLAYVAYGYFILLGALDLILSFLWGGIINYWALFAVAVFAVQVKYKNKLTNLILGVLTLGGSIFFMLEFLARAHKVGFTSFTITMSSVAILGIVMSVVLIFSYTRLSFNDN